MGPSTAARIGCDGEHSKFRGQSRAQESIGISYVRRALVTLNNAPWRQGAAGGAGLPFQHLILPHPTRGLWVPVDFDKVIFPDEALGLRGQFGSSVRLKAECEELAEDLRLPLDLDPEDEAVQEAKFNSGRSRTRWKKYGVEPHNLLALHRACQESIRLGSAIYVG